MKASRIVSLACLAVAACAPQPTQLAPSVGPSAQDSASPNPISSASSLEASCRGVAEKLSTEQRIGQLFMVAVKTDGLGETERAAISEGHIGSVVLLGDTTQGAQAITRLTASLSSLGTATAPIMVAVDQEGGSVQRLKGAGFSDIPSAREQGRMVPAQLQQAATAWGKQLKQVGVHYDLAPVADVVAESKRSSNAPIGALRRDYGSDPDKVAASISAFVKGMREAGVATSVKHFPGLGEVSTNTDFGAARDEITDRSSAGLAPFKEAIAAGAGSVMISSAVFAKIDKDTQAVFSKTIVTGLLREELGFRGVAIADDLGAAKSVADIDAGERALRFFDAGGDLLINADPKLASKMTTAVLRKAKEDSAFSRRVDESVTRILRLKASTGLMRCS